MARYKSLRGRQGKNFALPPCPPPGGGVHNWIIRSAWCGRKAGLTPSQAAELIAAAITRPPDPKNEIETAVARAYSTTIINDGKAQPKWPAQNLEQVEAVIAEGGELVDLWEASPIRCDEDLRAADVLKVLFPPETLLCVAKCRERAVTLPLSKVLPLVERLQFVSPNPMLTKWGTTQTGRRSQRTLENVAARRFLIVEIDRIGDRTPTKDEQSAILWHLAGRAPLALVVDSGNKSLHGWFYCAGQPETKVLSFFRHAVSLGADCATWCPIQMVRMPGGRRDNGAEQTIFYFNPTPLTL